MGPDIFIRDQPFAPFTAQSELGKFASATKCGMEATAGVGCFTPSDVPLSSGLGEVFEHPLEEYGAGVSADVIGQMY